MSEPKAQFTHTMPAIEIRGGHVYFTINGKKNAVCTTVHGAELFGEALRRALVDWHASRGAVVPFRRPEGAG